MKFRLKPAAAAIVLAFSTTSALATLTVDGTGGTGTALSLKYQTANTRGDSLFVAAVVGGSQMYFIDENGQAQAYQAGQPTPYRLRTVTPNTLNTLMTITVPAWLNGTVDFYSAFGASGGDVLANNFAALDLGTLEHASVSAGPKGTAFVARGKVIDAAASGAVVCIDANFNRKCDSGEAQATAGADGTFALTATDTDAVQKSMIAVTSAGYVLEAPAGYYAVISPLTTLVQNELEVDGGMTVTQAAKTVGIEVGVSAELLTADFVAAKANAATSANAATAERVAQLLSQIWKKIAGETILSVNTDARRRAAIVQYSRNLTYKKGWVLHEALNQANQDPLQAFTLIAGIDGTLLTDAEREGKLGMLAEQRYRPEWVTKMPGDVYVGNPWAALTYDATTNRISFGLSVMREDGKLMQMDKTDARYATSAAIATLPSLSQVELNKLGATYVVNADRSILLTGLTLKTEALSALNELDLGGKTFKLGELIAFSKSVYSIPDEYNIPVTFQAGDKLWREHHDRTMLPLGNVTFTTKASGLASMEAYVVAKNSEFSSYATFGNYEVYFKPADAAAPLSGEMWAYNKVSQTRFKVGSYASRTENGRAYVFIEANVLKGVTGAAPTTVIYFDATTSEIKYASWRDYVMYCLCWQRKFNLSAAQRIMDALKAANSVLITAPTTTAPPTTSHALSATRTINIASQLSAQEAELLKQAVCGECAGGNCGACPIGNVIGLR